MKKMWILLLSLTFMNLIACVEVRDPAKEDQSIAQEVKTEQVPPQNNVQEGSDLIIDEEMYVYRGQILKQEGVRRIMIEDQVQGRPPINVDEESPKEIAPMKFRNVIFKSQGVLYTYGNHLKISAEFIDSNHGKIKTFPNNTKAKKGTPGRHGGSVTFDAKDAIGLLEFEMRGETGGDGFDGVNGYEDFCYNKPKEFFDAQPGQAGLRGGDSGFVTIFIQAPSPKFDARIETHPGLGGIGGHPGTPSGCANGATWNPGNIAYRGVGGQDAPNGAAGIKQQPDGMWRSNQR